MTDWTTPEDVPATTVERLHRWLLQKGNPADATTGERAVADIIRAFWPVPAPTLSEELREHVAHGEDMVTWTRANVEKFASRAEQIEEALAVEGRRVEKIAAERDETKKERDHFFREVENVRNWKEQLLNECDEARAEVERLTVKLAESQASPLPTTDTHRAERQNRNPKTKRRVVNSIHELETVTVQKDAESMNSDPIPPGMYEMDQMNPADVPPNEPWLVSVWGREALASRNGYEEWPWSVAFYDGGLSDLEDGDVTLVSRLVPAPRVITSVEELDALPYGTIIRDKNGDAGMKRSYGLVFCGVEGGYHDLRKFLPATVLWESKN